MPEYAVVRPLRWTQAEDRVDLFDPERQRWIALSPWTADVLQGVQDGAPLRDIADRIETRDDARKRQKAVTRVKRFVYSLSRLGYVDLPLPPPPPRFQDRYEVVRELGRGGVGVAYLCRDTATPNRSELVVKRAWDFLQPYAITEAAMRREAKVMRSLDHPGIARYRDEFELDGHLHLVRDFVRGDDLSQVLGVGIPDLDERRRAIAGVADVLVHLHDRGYVLLDLRPSNFLRVPPHGDVNLLDVGGCRELPPEGLTFHRRVGSPGFMSPEMAADKRADARSDVWGLGRLLAFLGTGGLPAPDDDAEALARRAPPEDAPLLRRLAADDPADRPATMRAARELLLAG